MSSRVRWTAGGAAVLGLAGVLMLLPGRERVEAQAPENEGPVSRPLRERPAERPETAAKVSPTPSLHSLATGSVTTSPDGGVTRTPIPVRALPTYTLHEYPGSVAVLLDGGVDFEPSPVWARDPEPAPTRHLRGRVQSRSGAPLAGAVVIVGQAPSAWRGQLSGAVGATTGLDGSFDVARAPTTELDVVAMHSTGWSSGEHLAAGAEDAVLALVIDGYGQLAGRATIDGRPDRFTLELVQLPHGLTQELDSGPDGAFEFDALPPGRYRVVAALAQAFRGGSSRLSEPVEVEVQAGERSSATLVLHSGVTLVVNAVVRGGPALFQHYLLVTGAHELATKAAYDALVAALPPGSGDGMIYGGADVDTVMEFHDRAPGPYTACVETLLKDRSKAWGCVPVTLADGEPAHEISITPTAP